MKLASPNITPTEALQFEYIKDNHREEPLLAVVYLVTNDLQLHLSNANHIWCMIAQH
jgi:hypothetical protein